MMTRKEKRQLNVVKTNAIKLKENGQIPFCLYESILRLNFESSITSVEKLKSLSEKYMRIKGYYFRFPEYSYQCERELKLLHL